MNYAGLKKYKAIVLLMIVGQVHFLSSASLSDMELDNEEIVMDTPQEIIKPIAPKKAELQKPKIALTSVNNQTSQKLNIILGGDSFEIAPGKTEAFDIAFNLSPTTPALKIPNAVVRAYKSSGPIRIRLSEDKAAQGIKAPTQADLFLISVPYYQVNQAYGTEWANGRIIVEEASIRDIGKKSPLSLASWDNEGKNMRLSEGKHHDLKINLTVVEKPTVREDSDGNQIKSTYIDLENDALEVEVEETE